MTRLTAIPLFATLSPVELEPVLASVRELEVEAGANVVSEGDFGHALYAIESGTADVLRGDRKIASLGPGDIFGEVAVSSTGRRVATVRATSPMRLMMLFNRDFWRIEKEHPELATSLRAGIEKRLAELSET